MDGLGLGGMGGWNGEGEEKGMKERVQKGAAKTKGHLEDHIET